MHLLVFLLSLVIAARECSFSDFKDLNLTTNRHFNFTIGTKFSAIEKLKKIHPIFLLNPSFRPDSFQIDLFLCDKDGKALRQMDFSTVPAVDATADFDAAWFLPSYVVPANQTTEQVRFGLRFTNLDFILPKSTCLSPVVTIRRAESNEVEKEGSDELFAKYNDGDNVIISFLWSYNRVTEPDTLLRKSFWQRGGVSVSRQSLD